MAIMAVKEIPEVVHKATEYKGIKDSIRTDIEEAYNQGIAKFEIVGYYDSTPEYIGTCARDVAFDLFKDRIHKDAAKSVTQSLRKRFKSKLGDAVDLIKVDRPLRADPAITVTGITIGGIKRIFVAIDYDYINRYQTNMLDRLDKYYSKSDVQEDLKYRWERLKFHEELKRGK